VLRIGAIARRAETPMRFHLLPEIRNAGQIAGIGGATAAFGGTMHPPQFPPSERPAMIDGPIPP